MNLKDLEDPIPNKPRPQRTQGGNAFRAEAKAPPPKGNFVRNEIDLSPSTPKTRAGEQEENRRKGFRRAVGLIIVMVLIAFGYVAIKETIWANADFALNYVYVDTDGMLTPTELALATELKTGTNLLTLDLATVRSRLLKLPAVKEASVKRDYSGRLDVTVLQRQPVAWLHCENLGWVPNKPGAGLLVDATGCAFPCINRKKEYEHLPEIRDETVGQIGAGSPIEGQKFVATLDLLQKLQSRAQSFQDDVLSIKVEGPCALVATLKSGLVATFPWDDIDSSVRRYQLVAHEAKNQHRTLLAANLIAEYNVPVRFKPVPVAAPVTRVADVSTASTQRRSSRR